MIPYKCPHCGTVDLRPPYMAGQKTLCEYCKKPGNVPKPEPPKSEPIAKPTIATPQPVANWHAAPRFVYQMVQVPPTIEIQKGTSTIGQAAAYLEEIVNDYASKGWEFHRVDTIGVRVMPGCLGVFLGEKSREELYYVVTFRRPAG